ncbi:unnamed protein product, partial [Ectocarpus sp. 12 AP-2014]
ARSLAAWTVCQYLSLAHASLPLEVASFVCFPYAPPIVAQRNMSSLYRSEAHMAMASTASTASTSLSAAVVAAVGNTSIYIVFTHRFFKGPKEPPRLSPLFSQRAGTRSALTAVRLPTLFM